MTLPRLEIADSDRAAGKYDNLKQRMTEHHAVFGNR